MVVVFSGLAYESEKASRFDQHQVDSRSNDGISELNEIDRYWSLGQRQAGNVVVRSTRTYRRIQYCTLIAGLPHSNPAHDNFFSHLAGEF